MIKLRDIVKTYHLGTTTQTVLHGVSIDIHQGEMLAIMGESGSGKSTLMNIIGLLDRPTSGEYFLHDKKVAGFDDDKLADLRNDAIGFVFQQFYLLPRLSAEQNVELPLIYRRPPPADKKQKARDMLHKVGLTDRSHHKPNELSGGQQQRVAIARALVTEPSLILADEPTGALDSKTSEDIMQLFIELNQHDQKTVVIVTHDPSIAKQCQRTIHIKDGVVVE